MARTMLLLLLMLTTTVGCAGSRWARADPKYRRKYDHHTKDPARVIKQAIDARHVAGRGGYYLAGGGGDRNGEASIGVFNYPEPLGGAVEGYFGARGLLTPSGDGNLAGGLEGGLRLQAPSRVAPFVGVGAFAGWAPTTRVERSDGEVESALAGAVSPELGVHVWLTPRWRLTALAKHTVLGVEEGGGEDYTTFGLTLSVLDIPYYGESADEPVASFVDCADPLPLPQRANPGDRFPAEADSDNPYASLLAYPDGPREVGASP